MRLMLTIDGSVYAFGTQGCVTLPTDPSGELATTLTVVPGAFDWKHFGGRWSERMKPIDGDLDVSSLTFPLNDVTPASGPAAGHSLLTWLATRAPSLIRATATAAAISSTALSFTVADGSSFPTGSQVVWIEAEAILCDSRSGNTFTVNAAGRGYYMSRAVSHAFDLETALAPAVWAEFPWVTRRRTVLWYVNPVTNVATALWRGYCSRAPRLADDGARFELQCDQAWTVEKERTFVDANASCRLRGYNVQGLYFAAAVDGPRVISTPLSTLTPPYTHSFDTPDGCAAFAAALLRTYLLGLPSPPGVAQCDPAVNGNQLQLTVQTTGTANLTVFIEVAGHFAHNHREASFRSTDGADPRHATVSIDLPAAMVIANPVTPMAIPVDSVYGLPSAVGAWNAIPVADGHATTIQPLLRGQYDDATFLQITPSGVSAFDTSLDTAGPTVTGTMEPSPPIASGLGRFGPLYDAGAGLAGGLIFVDKDVLFLYAVQVSSDHWAAALKAALSDADTIKSGSDPRDWDWSGLDALVAATDSPIASRVWYFDGTSKLSGTLIDACALHGCGVAVRGSRLAIVPFRRPLANEPTAVNLTALDYPRRYRPTWSTFPDGLANVAGLQADNLTLNVQENRSIGAYGQGRTVKLRLTGVPIADEYTASPNLLASVLLNRVLYLWSTPIATAKVPVSLAHLLDVAIGDMVGLTDWMLPDGAGGRGLGSAAALTALGQLAQYGFVIGRDVDLKADVVWLECLLQPVQYGYSAAVRIASAASPAVTCATAFVQGAGDYTSPTGAADGGASKFHAGDPVRLVQRDVLTYTSEAHTVLSVAGGVITFHEPIGGSVVTSINTAGSMWELEFDDYGSGSAVSAFQRPYAWVSSATTGKIGSSFDAAQPWGP